MVMNKEQALAWFTLEGFEPVKQFGLRGFSDGRVFVYWGSSQIRIKSVAMMVVKPEPAYNMHRFKAKQIIRCAAWMAREESKWKV